MNVLRNNIVANYLGTAWISLFSLLLIPFYLKLLGPEAYGLVGFFLAFRASLAILDFGLSGYSTREVARRSSMKERVRFLGSYIRTIELVYWTIGLLLTLTLVLVAFLFPGAWLKFNLLSLKDVQISQIIFALTLGVSWPVSYYRGILRGLERQVEYNYVAVIASTFRGISTALALLFISPTVVTFFSVQMVSSILETLLMRNIVWRSIHKMKTYEVYYEKFKLKELIIAWREIVGISVISILGICITQADKLIISRQLPLEQLGYYTIAVTLAVSTSRLVDSIIVAIFPKFAASHIKKEHNVMMKIHEMSSEFVVLIYLPVFVCSMFFSEQLLFMWTDSDLAAIKTGEVLAILIAAQLFTKLSNISLNFQFAAGKIKLLIWVNILTFIIYLPILLILVESFGTKGAAISWLIINFIVCISLGLSIREKFISFTMYSKWFLKILRVLVPVVLFFVGLKTLNFSPNINLFILIAVLAIYYVLLGKKIWLALSHKKMNKT
jgi:O-antigen/teichoic acid export membrane protein